MEQTLAAPMETNTTYYLVSNVILVAGVAQQFAQVGWQLLFSRLPCFHRFRLAAANNLPAQAEVSHGLGK